MSMHAKISILTDVSCSTEPITIYEKIINHIKYDLALVYIERVTFRLICKGFCLHTEIYLIILKNSEICCVRVALV